MIDLGMEREALYQAIVSLPHERMVTQNQVGILAGLFSQGLRNKRRENRILVMDYLIGDAIEVALGVEFVSFKNMSGEIAEMLITLFREPDSWRLSQRGRDIIAAAENSTKAYTSG